MDSFRDQTILITGASSGIGEAMARQLAAVGGHLILVARRHARLEALAQELTAQHGTRVQTIMIDLTDANAAAFVHQQVVQRGGRVDVLINNAGVGYLGEFHSAPAARYQRIMQLNMQVLVDLTRLFLPDMLQRRQGGILNVASVAGLQAIPYFAVYAATKAFVISFSEALWQECQGAGVAVSALCPGVTDTEFFAAADINQKAMRLQFMQSADTVAAIGLKGLLKNQPVVQTNPALKPVSLLGKFLPRKWVVAASGALIKSRL